MIVVRSAGRGVMGDGGGGVKPVTTQIDASAIRRVARAEGRAVDRGCANRREENPLCK